MSVFLLVPHNSWLCFCCILLFVCKLGWHREGNPDDDFSTDANNTFENKWRERWITQSQKASHARDSTSGFDWREGWSWTTQSQRSKSWNNEPCDESLNVGSRSERIVLGLPLDGPIKIDDVKNA